MKTKNLFFFTLLLLVMPAITFAQDCDPGDPGGCGVVDTPIDSWLVVLLIAGAFYGFRKYRNKPKTECRIVCGKSFLLGIFQHFAELRPPSRPLSKKGRQPATQLTPIEKTEFIQVR